MDELKVFTGNAHPSLAKAICEYLGIPLGKAEVFEFSNENIFVRILENVRERDIFVIQPLSTPVNKNLVELLIMIDAFKRASAGRITAVIPYYGYSRTDKKDQPRVPITARLIADLLTTAGANRLLTIDLHAAQKENQRPGGCGHRHRNHQARPRCSREAECTSGYRGKKARWQR
jgi:ribose-phosphate pyrophosphokinase